MTKWHNFYTNCYRSSIQYNKGKLVSLHTYKQTCAIQGRKIIIPDCNTCYTQPVSKEVEIVCSKHNIIGWAESVTIIALQENVGFSFLWKICLKLNY